MKKLNKTRTICMNCLHSIITDFNEGIDPIGTRLVTTWSCPKCEDEAEQNDIQFFDYQIRELHQSN
jgi:RNase P subunit RPR2